jgi:hypothetical protein
MPLEGECSACGNVQFKLFHDPRRPFHQPDRERYRELLQRQFEEHLKVAHPTDSAGGSRGADTTVDPRKSDTIEAKAG